MKFKIVFIAISFYVIIFSFPNFSNSQNLSGKMGTLQTGKEGLNEKLNKQVQIDLDTPVMIYPSNGSTNVPIVPGFILNTVDSADRYELQV